MGYYSGTANDMTAVRTALVNACVLEGWVWDGMTEMLSKGTMFLRLQVVSGYLRLLGRTSLAGGDMTHVVQMGPFAGHAAEPLPALAWPVGYEIFLFDQEVYCLINYAVDVYQWCAFGKSTVQGLPGTGMWVGATASGVSTNYSWGIVMRTFNGYSSGVGALCPALFWATAYAPEESRVHSGLDGQGWWMSQGNTNNPVGITSLTPLISLLPNVWNSETVLLPIRAYKVRPSSTISLVADLEHSRHTRVDNYTPGQIISIGAERWKIFPWYRKNVAVRNGGELLAHTGTFGWAIRYEGP